MTDTSLIFVYGTLRLGYAGDMARWLANVSDHHGRGLAPGRLYRVADYPGYRPGSDGWVVGDLFVLQDPLTAWPVLDRHEECSEDFPEPHEYRRERIMVQGSSGPVAAWTYIYAHDPLGLEPIAGGDFLA